MAKQALKEAIARAEAEAETGDETPDLPEQPTAPDDEEGEAEQPATPTPQPEPPSEEAQVQALVKALAAFEKAIEKATGTTEPLEPSPYPWVYGFVVPGEPSYQRNPAFKSCETCNGLGDVLTGSRKNNYETQPCPRCGGRGYLDALPAGQPVPAPTVALPETNGSEQTYGTPAWMGDPTVGGQRY